MNRPPVVVGLRLFCLLVTVLRVCVRDRLFVSSQSVLQEDEANEVQFRPKKKKEKTKREIPHTHGALQHAESASLPPHFPYNEKESCF